MGTKAQKWAKQGAIVALGLMTAVPAMAGGQIFKDGDKTLTMGAAMRTSLDLSHSIPTTSGVWTNDLSNAFDIYTDFDLNPKVGFTLNLTYANTAAGGTVGDLNEVGLMDLVARYKLADELNIWVGRIIPPNTRSNISGSYYMAPWNYPGNTDVFPALKFGRDDGMVLWGDLGGKGMFKYFVGAFEGKRTTTINTDKNPEAIAKVTYNVLDGEPGYYHSSTYYGTKKILAFSLAGEFQSYGAGNPATTKDANQSGSTLDILYEMPFDGIGTFTLEAAGFYFDSNNNAGADQFKGSSLLLAYLLPGNKIQFYGRYESKEEVPVVTSYFSKEDYGVQYLLDSYNARFVLTYSNTKSAGVSSKEGVNISSQLMF